MLLFAGLAGQDLQQINSTDQLLDRANAQCCQPFTGFHRNKFKEVGRHGNRSAIVVIAQTIILSCNPSGTVIEVTDTQVFTT